MTDRLPPNLLALFAPRPPLRWVPPCDFPAEERKTANVSGLADFLPALASYETEYKYTPTESWLEMRDRKKVDRKADVEKQLKEGPKSCMHTSIAVLLPIRRKALTDCSRRQTQ
jgi:U1 small nuclear ribonucleoprotein